MEVLQSNKGRPQIAFNGFLYNKKGQSPNGSKFYWICTRKHRECKGSLITTSELEGPEEGKQHNHLPDMLFTNMAKARNTMKQRAEQGDKPCRIYREVVASADEDVVDFLPSISVCSRAMRRAQAKTHPRAAKKLSELTFTGTWRTTGGDNGEDFLQADSGQGEQRVVLFATNRQLKALAEATEWYMDGNFAMSPDLFKQLYIIRVPLGGSSITTLYALLSKKTQTTYETMLDLLLRRLEELDLELHVERVVLDFESAVINAVRSRLGNDIIFGGCFFHLTQSTYRQIQSKGLANLYKQDAEFAQFIGMIDALALLPVCDVKQGMAHLQSNCPEEAKEVLDYFDATYVNGAQRGRSARRTRPLFPPEVWNQHAATLAGGSRTNNVSETWNSMFKKLVGHKHPTVWSLIDGLRKDVAEVTKTLRQADLGDLPQRRPLRAALATLHRRQQQLAEDYIAGNLTLPGFLRKAGKNIRLRR